MPKLPPEHLKNKPTVGDMMIGESGYVIEIAVEVYDDDTAYLWDYTTVIDEALPRCAYIERRADGFYVKLGEGSSYRPNDHRYKRTDNLCEIVAWLE